MKLSSKLIVSCQAENGNPFNDLSSVVKFAMSAKIGGAGGIRSEGILRSSRIIKATGLPIIGLIKNYFEDGSVAITTKESDFIKLMNIGCDIIAIDGTFRLREGLSGPEIISMFKRKYNCLIMADVSTIEEAISCANSGADYISSTLNGYTPWTLNDNNGKPNYSLIKEMIKYIKRPIVAEGRISSPEQAKKVIEMGCAFVVVGSFITRPHIITEAFVKEIK